MLTRSRTTRTWRLAAATLIVSGLVAAGAGSTGATTEPSGDGATTEPSGDGATTDRPVTGRSSG